MASILNFLKGHTKFFSAVAFSTIGYIGSTSLSIANQDPLRKAVGHFNDVYHIVFENASKTPVQLSFGDMTGKTKRYFNEDKPIVLAPREAISRRLQTKLRSLRSNRYFVVISKGGNMRDPAVEKCEFIYLHPDDTQFSKVVTIRDERVDIANNPNVRNFQVGRIASYEPPTEIEHAIELFKNWKIVYTPETPEERDNPNDDWD